MYEESADVMYTISFVVNEFLQFDLIFVRLDFLNVLITEQANLKDYLQLTCRGPDDVFLAFPFVVLIC